MGSKTTSKDEVLEAISHARELADSYMKQNAETKSGQSEVSQAAFAMAENCESPVDKVSRMLLKTVPPMMAMRVAMEAGWLHELAKVESATTEELAKKSGAEKNVVVRIMRVLTSNSLVQELGLQKFAATDVTRTFLFPGLIDIYKHCCDTTVPTYARLAQYLSNTSYAEPADETIGPHTFAHGLPIWKRLSLQPALNEQFNRAMIGSRTVRDRPDQLFPFDKKAEELGLTADDILLVDIGGGMGHQTKAIRDAFPHVKGKLVVQDLPHVIEHARQQSPSEIENITFLPQDMFAPQPARTQGAAFYMFSCVFHDWLDKPILQALKHVKEAMKKGYSKLLIFEMVLKDEGADWKEAGQDLWMMADCCGKERTRGEWEDLMERAGLRVEEVWRSATGSLVEVGVA